MTPKWPKSNQALTWALCAAEWGLRDADEARDYAHFALDHLVDVGEVRRARTLVGRLLATPPRDPVRRVMDVRAVVGALLDLGDAPAAEAALESLSPLIAKQKQKRDADYLRGAIVELREQLGLSETTDPRRRVKALERMATAAWRRGEAKRAREHARAAARLAVPVGWGSVIVALLLTMKSKKDALALWKRLPASERDDTDLNTMIALGLKAAASRRVKRLAALALKRLQPSEWNVHHVLLDLERSYSALRALKLTKLADSLLEATVTRMRSGQFDQRGFASSAAYVSLARMVFHTSGWEGSRAMLERAMLISGTPRGSPMVVSVALELGHPTEAVEWARRLPASERESSLIPALIAAKRWPEALAALERIKDPKVAARVAWSQVRRG